MILSPSFSHSSVDFCLHKTSTIAGHFLNSLTIYLLASFFPQVKEHLSFLGILETNSLVMTFPNSSIFHAFRSYFRTLSLPTRIWLYKSFTFKHSHQFVHIYISTVDMINKIHHRTVLPPQHAFRSLQKRLKGDLFMLLVMDVEVFATKDSSISFMPHTTK